MTTVSADTVERLARRVRTHLRTTAVQGTPVTYQAVARALALAPPNTIHQLTEALEFLMGEDAANGHPFIAALVISRTRGGLPAPGFFERARALGRFDGDEAGPEAWAFHAAEFHAAITSWARQGQDDERAGRLDQVLDR